MFDFSLLPPDSIRPLKREEFDRLAEMGVFGYEKVELLYGLLVRMSPQGAPHSDAVQRLARLLDRALGDRARVFSHSPFIAMNESKPEPDIAVVPPADYSREQPRRAFLLVEASDSSLRIDRAFKAPLYAASNVPEYWILDLQAGAVEVYRDPSPEGFRSVTRHARGTTLSLAAFPDVTVAVSDFLPPSE